MAGDSDAETRNGIFGDGSYWSNKNILFGGVAANWLIAIIIFTILAWTGMPEFLDGQFTVASDLRVESTPVEITSVAENSPASIAGILEGDRIIAIDGNEFMHGSEISDYNQAHAGETVVYTIQRNVSKDHPCECSENSECDCAQPEEGELIFDQFVTLNPSDSEYLLGVTMATTQSLSYSTWSAPVVGVGLTAQITGETFKGVGVMLWNLVTGVGSLFSPDANIRQNGQEAISAVGDSVAGPVGIIGIMFPAFTSAGPTNLAFLTALISVSLACMNVLPIPALDGGRWLLITIYKLRKKKLTKEIEERIVSRAMMVLLALIFIVTILDIIRIAK